MIVRQHYYAFDWLRIIAAFGIIGCHLALPDMTEGAMFLKRYTDLNVGVFAAIAVFFTAYSLQKRLSVVDFIKRRIAKLLIPLYVWSLFYITIDIFFDLLSNKPLTFQPFFFRYWYSVLICGEAGTQTWFLASLFYTQIFFYYPIKKNFFIPTRWINILLFIFAIVGITISCNGGYWTFYFLRLFSFFLVGVVMFRERCVLEKVPLCLVYLLILIGGLIIATGFRYGFIGECVLSFPMLLWGLLWSPKTSFIRNAGELLGRLSFGVYLIHFLFCRIFCLLLIKIGLPSNAWFYMLDLILVGLTSLLFSYILLRITKRWGGSFIIPS